MENTSTHMVSMNMHGINAASDGVERSHILCMFLLQKYVKNDKLMKQTPLICSVQLPDTSFSLDMTSSELLLSVPQESVARPRHQISRAHEKKNYRHTSYLISLHTHPHVVFRVALLDPWCHPPPTSMNNLSLSSDEFSLYKYKSAPLNFHEPPKIVCVV